MSIEAKISAAVDAFVSELTAMVRQAALEEVRVAIAASPLSASSLGRDERRPTSSLSAGAPRSARAPRSVREPAQESPPSKRRKAPVQLSFLDDGPATVRSEKASAAGASGTSAAAGPSKATSLSRIASVVGNVQPAAPSSTRPLDRPRIIPIPATFTAPLEPKREPPRTVGPLPPIQVLPPRGRRRRSSSPAKPKPVDLTPTAVDAARAADVAALAGGGLADAPQAAEGGANGELEPGARKWVVIKRPARARVESEDGEDRREEE